MNTTTRTPAIESQIDLGGANITLGLRDAVLMVSFSDGRTLSLTIDQLAPPIVEHAIMHGLKQKLVDAAAISRNPDTGKTASIDDKYNAVKEVYDRLLSGQWNKNRDAGAVRGGLLFRALCMLYPDKTGDAIKAFLEKKTAAEKTALRNTPKIADIIATLKADEPDTETDTDALLDELNG
jgi:hypothetical protein